MDKKIKKKKWTLKRIGLSLLGLIFLSFVLYSFLFADKRSKVKVDAEKITFGNVKNGTFQDFIPVTGTVLPIATYYLDAIEGGTIASIEKESGNILKEGDIILHLTNTSLELNVLSQESILYEQINRSTTTRLQLNQNDLNQQGQLAEIDYQLQLLKPQFDRYKRLFDKQLISEREFEEVAELFKYNRKRRQLTYASYRQDSLSRSFQLNQINASENRMRKSLDGVSRILNNLVVRAPINGQLATPELEIGQSIVRGERLGQVDVLDSFKVRVRIDELYLPRVDKGLNGTFQFANQKYEIEIVKIYPTITDGRFEVDTEFTAEQPAGIKRGQSVRIRLELGNSAQALLLPVGGFYKDTGGNWVFVVSKDGSKAERRDIRLGRKNPEYFEVMGGLEPGDRVITSSYDHFGDNEVLLLK
ncbi:efflux RND transporter periplasmic adaptor subunit [Bacteroidota bacterium]